MPLDVPPPVDASAALDAMPRSDAKVPASQEAGADDAASVAEAGATYSAVPIANPPSYKGTKGGSSACTQSYRTFGYAPGGATGARYPLFLYFVGTSGGASDESARFDGRAPDGVNRAMAERGFVALSVEYDNALASIFTNKLPCLFGAANPESVLANACAHPAVDCARGIATWGHSQGALLAHAAANDDARVRAVWTTGYSGLPGAKLPIDRFRTVNGEGDGMNAAVAAANKTAGFGAADACPDDGRDRCLRADGSGWILVRKSACQLSAADHCWFNKRSCIDGAETLEPNWVDPASNAPFALGPNADWVARTVAR